MLREQTQRIFQSGGTDDGLLVVEQKDFSGGINTRIFARDLTDNQAVSLTNLDITTPAALYKAKGSVKVGSLASLGSDVICLHNFDIQGADDQLLNYHKDRIYKWVGTGNWVNLSLTSLMSGATDALMISAKESGLTPDDIVLCYNGRNNVFRIAADGSYQDLGNTTNSPPLTDVMCWYGNRVWCLKDDLLYYSDAYDSDYSGAFDRSANAYRIPVGDQRGLVPTRDMGIVVLGKDAIWAIAPSVTPAATDKPEPLIPNMGCVSKRGFAAVADDIYFFSYQGLFAVKRNVQDKLQLHSSNAISYLLKSEFDDIAWEYIDRLSMKYFDNKLFIAVPTGANTYDTWIYYPATNGFTKKTGLSPKCWAVYKVDGKEKLYYGKQGRNDVFEAWTGYTDEGSTTTNGTAQTSTLETKLYDFGKPMTEKVGGEVEVEADASTSGSLSVSAKIDNGAYTSLGTVDLSTSSVSLPIDLPFTLYDSNVIRKKFHLDGFGDFRSIQIKVENSQANTEDVIMYNVNVVAFPQEYENE